MAASLARVVRMEYPKAWPNVFHDLRARLERETEGVHVLSVLSAVREVVEMLLDEEEEEREKQARQVEQRAALGAEARPLLEHVHRLWLDAHTQLLALLAQFTQGQLAHADLASQRASLLGRLSKGSVQLVRVLLKHYLTRFVLHDSSSIYAQYAQYHHFLVQSVACVRALGQHATPLTPDLEALVLRLQKLVVESHEAHPVAFVPILEPFLALFDQELLAPAQPYPQDLDGFWEKYVIDLLSFLANVLHCRDYTLASASASSAATAPAAGEPELPAASRQGLCAQAAGVVGRALSTAQLMRHVQQLLQHWLQLKPATLRLWKEDPEEVLGEEISDAYRYRIEPCAEYFFHRLLGYDPALAAPLSALLVETLQRTQGRAEPGAVLLRDAALNLLALSYHTLARPQGPDRPAALSFHALFPHLAHDYAPQGRALELGFVLRRRVVALVQHWSTGIGRAVERDVYRLLVAALQDDDLLVRVYGALALRAMLDDFDFAAGEYLEFLKPSLEALIDLVRLMSDSSTTVYLLDQVCHIVETMQEHVRPYLALLVRLCQHLWSLSQDKRAVQAGIVRVLAKLVEELTGAATELEPQLLPVLKHCCNPASRDALMLQDEGLALWQVLVEQSAYPSPALLAFAPQLLVVLRAAQDDATVLDLGLRILYAYVLNGKSAFLHAHATLFVDCCRHVLQHARRGKLLVRLCDLLLLPARLFPQEGAKLLVDSGLLVHCFTVCLAQRHERAQYDVAFLAAYELLCRLRLHAPHALAALFDALQQGGAQQPLLTWLRLGAHCLEPKLVDSLECAVALVAGLALFLPEAPPDLLPDLPTLVNVLAALAADFLRRYNDKRNRRRYKRRLHRFVPVSPAKRSFSELKKKDPLHFKNVDLRARLRSALQELMTRLGGQGEAFFQALKPETQKFFNS